MNLLLLLSAMLSALSGAGVGTRATPAAVTVNAVTTVAAATRVARAVVVGRPVPAEPSRVAIATGEALPRWRIAPALPLYLSRRRE